MEPAKRGDILGLSGVAFLLTAAAAVFVFAFAPAPPLPRRVPDPANRRQRREAVRVDIAGTFQRFRAAPQSDSAPWPGFRGPRGDNIVRQRVPLARSVPANGFPQLWRRELGEGYAGPAVHDGRVYLLDYDEKTMGDSLRCFDLTSGRELWRRTYQVQVKRNHGRSRTVPAVDGRHVVTIGPKCHVMCVDAQSGAFRWGIDLVRRYGTKVPLWYTGQCPLIDNGTAVLAPAGKNVLIMGVDLATGETVWSTPNPGEHRMSHASVVIMTFAGKRMYVYAAVGGITAVAADGPHTGRVMWQTTAWKHDIIAPSPVQCGPDRFFITSGHGAGSAMFRVRRHDGRFQVEREYVIDKSVFACEQQTPIYYRGRLFGIMPNDAGAAKQQLVSFDPANRVVWRSGKERRFGLGPFILADGRFYILDDRGHLTIAAASPERYRELGHTRILEGKDSWAPLAIVDGLLLARDDRDLVCLDIRRR